MGVRVRSVATRVKKKKKKKRFETTLSKHTRIENNTIKKRRIRKKELNRSIVILSVKMQCKILVAKS